MKKMMMFFCSIAALVGVSACSSTKQIKHCATEDFEQLIRDKDVQLVDVRRADEFQAGHINGACLIDVQEADFLTKAVSQLDKSRPVAVYCRSGKRSREAARQLAKKGYTVYNLDKGYLDWKEQHK